VLATISPTSADEQRTPSANAASASAVKGPVVTMGSSMSQQPLEAPVYVSYGCEEASQHTPMPSVTKKPAASASEEETKSEAPMGRRTNRTRTQRRRRSKLDVTCSQREDRTSLDGGSPEGSNSNVPQQDRAHDRRRQRNLTRRTRPRHRRRRELEDTDEDDDSDECDTSESPHYKKLPHMEADAAIGTAAATTTTSSSFRSVDADADADHRTSTSTSGDTTVSVSVDICVGVSYDDQDMESKEDPDQAQPEAVSATSSTRVRVFSMPDDLELDFDGVERVAGAPANSGGLTPHGTGTAQPYIVDVHPGGVEDVLQPSPPTSARTNDVNSSNLSNSPDVCGTANARAEPQPVLESESKQDSEPATPPARVPKHENVQWRRRGSDVVAAMYPASVERRERLPNSGSRTVDAMFPATRHGTFVTAPRFSAALPKVDTCLEHLAKHVCHWVHINNTPSDEVKEFDIENFSYDPDVVQPDTESITKTLKWLFRVLQIEPQCCVVAAIYLQRVMAKGVVVTVHNYEPLLLASVLLATKIWDDMSTINEDFAKAMPHFTLPLLNRLESRFLNRLRWDCFVSRMEYTKFYFGLVKDMSTPDDAANCGCLLQTLSKHGCGYVSSFSKSPGSSTARRRGECHSDSTDACCVDAESVTLVGGANESQSDPVALHDALADPNVRSDKVLNKSVTVPILSCAVGSHCRGNSACSDDGVGVRDILVVGEKRPASAR